MPRDYPALGAVCPNPLRRKRGNGDMPSDMVNGMDIATQGTRCGGSWGQVAGSPENRAAAPVVRC